MGDKGYTDSLEKNASEGWSLLFILKAVFRHWKLIILFPVIFAVLLGGGSLLLPTKFETRVVLEIGQYKVRDEARYIESPESVAEKMEVNLALAMESFKDQGQSSEVDLNSDLTVSAKPESGLVEVSLRIPKKSSDKLIYKAVDILESNHESIFSVIRQEHTKKLEMAEAALQSLKQQYKFFGSRLQQLEKEESVLQSQINHYSAKLEQLTENLESLYKDGTDRAVVMMLRDNAIGRIQDNVNELQKRFYSEIPAVRRDHNVRMEEIHQDMVTQRADIKKERLILNNMVETRPVIGPRSSEKPVSPKPFVFGAFGVVLGGLISLITVLIVEYLRVYNSK